MTEERFTWIIDQLNMAEDAVSEFVDSVELWVEDQDGYAEDFLQETTRHIFEEVPIVALLAVIEVGEIT